MRRVPARAGTVVALLAAGVVAGVVGVSGWLDGGDGEGRSSAAVVPVLEPSKPMPAGSGAALSPDGSSTAPSPATSTSPPVSLPLAEVAGTPTSQSTVSPPTTVTMPSGVRADVLPAGVDAEGVLDVPEDPQRIGWWTGGAMPGEPFGSMVLAGHVDSRELGLGVLAELRDVEVGDVIVVAGDAGQYRYEVESAVSIPKARLAEGTEAFRHDVDHRLVLITCVGEFDERTRSYADNLVVTATALP